MRIWVARTVFLGILAVAAFGFWQGTPQDVVAAVRRGDVEGLKSALARDPANVHTKVYAQAYERLRSRSDYISRTGRDPWEGRYIIHDAVEFTSNTLPILDALAAGGADLQVRLKGETLLHLAAAIGNIEVATWLLDNGANVNSVNNCADGCAELGYTPLHSGLEFRDDEMTVLLLARGARLEATGADGRTAMSKAALHGKLSGAFVLARHGADLTRADGAGRTPFDLAGVAVSGAVSADADFAKFKQWFAPDGPFATVSAMVRASGEPMSEDDARDVLAKFDTTLR